MQSRKVKIIVLGVLIFGGLLAFLGRGYEKEKQFWGWEPYRFGVYEKRGETGRLTAVSYYPAENRAETIVFDLDDLLNASSKYGQFTAEKLADLDEQEKASGRIIKSTLESNLGIFVRGLAVSDKKKGKLAKIDQAWVKAKIWSQISNNRGSLVQKVDAFRVYLKALNLNDEDISTVSLNERSVWDDTDSRVFAPQLFDRLVSVKGAEPPGGIVPVLIVNGTQREGLALTLARILEREGYEVIRTESTVNLKPEETKSLIEVNREDNPDAQRQRLGLITGIEVVKQTQTQERYAAKVILGYDFDRF